TRGFGSPGLLAAGTPGTIHACVSSNHTFTHVSVSSALTCPSQRPVSWPANLGPVPSPSPSPSPSPTPTPPTGSGCTGTASSGDIHCGPYSVAGDITNSNGFNTYDNTNCWGHPNCGYAISAPDPATATHVYPFSVTANEP